MAKKGYIERGNAAFDAQFALICQKTAENTGGSPPIWSHIPPAETAKLDAAFADWHPRFEKAERPERSRIDVEERNEARSRAEPVLRAFCRRFFYDVPEAVTGAQLESMGLRPHDHIRTVHGKPQWRVAVEVEPSRTRTHLLRWHVAETGDRALPDDCNGWVLVWRVLEPGQEAALDPEEFGHSVLVTRNPYEVVHKNGDEGKRVAYCGAFQSRNRGIKGDWGEIVVAVLP